MKPSLLLRIAAVLTLFHCIAHTAGGVLAPPAPGPQAAAAAAMQATSFDAMGATRTYWDFHQGYGVFVTVVLLALAVHFWLLARIVHERPDLVRPQLVPFAVLFLAITVSSYRYFFAAPAVNELLIAACLGLAFRAAGRAVAVDVATPAATR